MRDHRRRYVVRGFDDHADVHQFSTDDANMAQAMVAQMQLELRDIQFVDQSVADAADRGSDPD